MREIVGSKNTIGRTAAVLKSPIRRPLPLPFSRSMACSSWDILYYCHFSYNKYFFMNYICVSCHRSNKILFCRLIIVNGNFIIKVCIQGFILPLWYSFLIFASLNFLMSFPNFLEYRRVTVTTSMFCLY